MKKFLLGVVVGLMLKPATIVMLDTAGRTRKKLVVLQEL